MKENVRRKHADVSWGGLSACEPDTFGEVGYRKTRLTKSGKAALKPINPGYRLEFLLKNTVKLTLASD